jgi:hypothetical protein
MFSLDSLTSITKSNILGNVSLHFIPPISGLKIMVHLIPSWMNGISRLMRIDNSSDTTSIALSKIFHLIKAVNL